MEIFTQIAKDYGLFAALVAYILWFFNQLIKENRLENAERETRLLAENSQRESRYMTVIDRLSDSFARLTTEVETIKTLIQSEDRRAPK